MKTRNLTPLRTAVIYAIFGVLWILLSDSAVELIASTGFADFGVMQTLKGWLYVLVSAGLIYLILRRDVRSLQESEERYRLFFECSLDAVLLTDPADGRVLAANPAACAMFGRTEEEIKQAGRNGLVDLTDPRLKPALEKRARTGHFLGEVNFLHRDGTTFPGEVSSSMFTDKNGNIRTIMIIRDITGRKRAEEALQKSELRFRSLIEHGLDNISLLAADGSLLWESPATIRTLGYEHNQFIGRNIFELIHPDDLEFVQSQLGTILKEAGRVVHGLFRLKHANGSWRWAECTGTNLLHEPSVNAIVVNYRDITERKQTEEALKDSEDRYRDLVENSLSLIFTHNLDGNLLSVNESMVKLTGYSREALLGMNLRDALDSSGDEQFAAYIREIKEKGHAQGLMKVRLANGDLRVWAYNNTLRTEGMNGPVVRGSARDITERKQAEDALWESEERFRKAFRAGPVGIAITRGSDSIYIDANDAFSELVGFSYEELMGQTSLRLKIVTPEQRWEYTQQVSEHGFIYNHEMVLRHKSGEPRTVLGSMELIELNHEACVLTTAIDITERKKAEAALARSEQAYRTLFENVPIGLYRTSEDGQLLDANPTLAKMFGYKDRVSLLGKHIIDLYVDPGDEEKFRIEMKNGDIVTNFEAEYRRLDGRTFWTEDHIRAVRDETGNVLFYEGSLIDITDRRQAEKLIQQYASDLEQRVEERTAELVHANRTKDEFLAGMSHELRTPLSGILGFSETLLEGVHGPINEKQTQDVKLIQSSGEHLLGLINDILDVSKIESGTFELQLEKIHVNDVCLSSLNFIKQLAHKKSIDVEYSPSPSTSMVVADPRRLKQILVNLLNNAVKFTPQNGRVKLEVHEDAKAGELQFTVTDNGIGIAPENLQKLFKPFVQLDSSLSRQYEGTGLGLSLVKKLVELHGGRVGVESELGRGSSFHFSIPLRDMPLVREEISLAMDGQGKGMTGQIGKTRRILIVEDNPINMMVTSDYLNSKGYEIIEVRDGFEAIEKVHQQKPDLILMDIQMPGIDGLETIKRLRAMPEFVTVPIIALTALAMSGDRERCLEAGANEYLAKPFSLLILAEMIENLL